MRRVAGVLAAALLIVPAAALAHGAGMTLSQQADSYFVDVDYELPAVVAGDTGRFDFKLFTDETRAKPVDFTQAWVRIVRKSDIPEGDTIFSGWVAKPAFGTTGFSISLPQSGEYSVLVRFNKGDEEIVEATLPFSVLPAPDQNAIRFDQNLAFGFACGVLLCALIGGGIYLKRSR